MERIYVHVSLTKKMYHFVNEVFDLLLLKLYYIKLQWCVSYKKQELLIHVEQLGSSPS